MGRIVVVHGLGEHAGRYGELAAHLSARGLDVLSWDQRGHGRSEGRRGTVRSFAHFLEDLDRVVALARQTPGGNGDPFLLGHSLGGLIVLRWLQTRKPAVRGAVISAPWLGTAIEVPLWKRVASEVLRRIAPDLTLPNSVRPELLTRDEQKREEYLRDPLVHHRISPRLYHEVLRAQRRTLEARLPSDIPLLFLVPGADRVTDTALTERWARKLAGRVRVDVLPDSRHEPLNEVDREVVYRKVGTWLDEVAGAEPPSPERVSV